jgi:hypothetical protein
MKVAEKVNCSVMLGYMKVSRALRQGLSLAVEGINGISL